MPSDSRIRPSRLAGIRRWALLLSVPCVGTLAMLVGLQRSMIYHPTRATRLPASEAHFGVGQAHDVVVQADDGVSLRGWLVLAHGHSAVDATELASELSSKRPCVLYFSGNAGHRAYRHEEIELLTRAGADVLLCDYRGYGDSEGEPTEENLVRDARRLWRYLTEERQIEAKRIVLFGESLGGGVAVRLASELCEKGTPPGGLILRSAFTSLPDAAAVHFPWVPVQWLLFDRFPNESLIGRVTCPILQFHGDVDSVVPIELGRRLFAAARERSDGGLPKQFVELKNGDHNDLLETSDLKLLEVSAAWLNNVAALDQ